MTSLFSPVTTPAHSRPPLEATTPKAPPPMNQEGTPAVVVDIDVIEAQKENIRPAAAGRSAATLSSLFEKKDAEAEKVLAEGHERFRREIEEADKRDREGEEVDGASGGDILDVYNRYIAFTIQHYPSNNTALLPLLETTVRKFIDDARFRQDSRYLKMWTLYTRHVERREDIWSFLETRDVGTSHAVFYEEYAGALEAIGRKKRADEIYRIGIARKAAPLERLKTRHQAFLNRIMAIGGQVPDDDPRPASAPLGGMPPRTPGGRSALGGISGAEPQHQHQQQQGAGAPGSTRISRAPNGAKMAIFTDGGADGARGEDTAPGEWVDIGTRDGRRKENVVEATPWKGETIPQKRVAPRTPKIEVFRETTDSDNGAVRPADDLFTRGKLALSEADMLKADPLRHFDLTAMTAATSSASASGSGSMAPPAAAAPLLPELPVSRKPTKHRSHHGKSAGAFAQPWHCPSDGPLVKGSTGKMERRVFDWSAVMKDGDEWSFEEVRARQRGLYGKEWRGDVKEWEYGWHEPGSSTPKKPVARRPPSPTMNTKLAEAEVAAFWDQTIHGKRAPRGDTDSESDSEDDNGEGGKGHGDDEDDDGPMMTEVIIPSPLPARQPPVAMLQPSSEAMVPPTPTPASSHFGGANRALMQTPIVFRDENPLTSAPPPSASKFNIFSDTPAKPAPAQVLAPKTPLASLTIPSAPASASTSKPKAFAVFSEEDEQDENAVPPTPSASAQSRAAPSNIFATPAVGDRAGSRRLMALAIPEEADEAEDDEENILRGVINSAAAVRIDESHDQENGAGEQYDAEEDEGEDGYPRRRQGRFRIHEMTPITERTCEYTTYNTLRSSALGSSTRTRSQSGMEGEDDDERDDAPAPVDDQPEFRRTSSVAGRDSLASDDAAPFPPIEPGTGRDSATGVFDGSGAMDPPFRLPDGFTIHAGNFKIESEPTLSAIDAPIEMQEPTAASTSTIPNPCDPIDDEVLAVLMRDMDPPISALPWLVDRRDVSFGRLDALQKHAKNRTRRGSTASRASVGGEDGFVIDLCGKTYEVTDKIGEGGFGAVFVAVDVAARAALDAKDDDDEDSDDEADEDACLVAIKVEKPSSVWEAVVLDRIHRRLDATLVSSIIKPRSHYAFADESYLLIDYCQQGTLLDLVNKASQLSIAPAGVSGQTGVDELLAIFFVVELLKLIDGLHSSGFIHGDLKIDNCLVRLEPIPASEGGTSAWSPQYSSRGDAGWSRKGLKLIDFGRAIDMSLFPATSADGRPQEFIAGWKVDENRDCLEMREGRPWSYQADYFGLAGIAYCLLFGKYISADAVVQSDTDGLYKIATPFKRYWQSAMWTRLFSTLLNPLAVSGAQQLPIAAELASIQEEMASWLEENCQKGGKNLRSMLKKVETAAILGRK